MNSDLSDSAHSPETVRPLGSTSSCSPASDVFTIDVEDWFHILEVRGTPDLAAWNSIESRVERNLRTLLELLAACNVKATCFVLGWIAERFPILLRDASDAGHEIASHGYGHQVLDVLSPKEFREDIRKAKTVIEEVTGRPAQGYRAPGFSITSHTPWAIEEIAAAGYTFDSSIFPAAHGHGGIRVAPRHPYVQRTPSGCLVEFPISVADTLFGPQCFFGGGYLRLYPLRLIQAMASRVRNSGGGVVWYIHPREIDPGHPRIPMPLIRKFKSYVNLSSTEPKLRAILASAKFVTFRDLAPQILKSAPDGPDMA
jgi:polysaccharide deacetylase family protein (PEP-CTERM system associated)